MFALINYFKFYGVMLVILILVSDSSAFAERELLNLQIQPDASQNDNPTIVLEVISIDEFKLNHAHGWRDGEDLLLEGDFKPLPPYINRKVKVDISIMDNEGEFLGMQKVETERESGAFRKKKLIGFTARFTGIFKDKAVALPLWIEIRQAESTTLLITDKNSYA